MVDELVSTRDESVDMDADSTRTMTMPMMTAGNEDNISGITASNPSALTST